MRPVIFISRSRKDLLSLPKLARKEIGFALYDVQRGVFPHFAKPLHGLGSGVFEIAIELEQGGVSCGLCRKATECHLRASCLSEEIEAWN